MTGKKGTGIAWRHTSVVIRADLFSKAHEQCIDISDLCNKALADLVGVDYRQQKLDNVAVPRPVIIAQNSPPMGEKVLPQGVVRHSPVINADDPTAGATVRSAKRQPKTRPAPKETEPVAAPLQKKEDVILPPAAIAAPAVKGSKPAAGKASRQDGLKKFVSSKITRSDAEDAVISKDDMYQAFTRFCREQKVAHVPDRKAFTIALKNKFAFFDKTVNSIPCWVNIRLK